MPPSTDEAQLIAALLPPDDLALLMAAIAHQDHLVCALVAALDPEDVADARRAFRGRMHRLLDESFRTVDWLADEEAAP